MLTIQTENFDIHIFPGKDFLMLIVCLFVINTWQQYFKQIFMYISYII